MAKQKDTVGKAGGAQEAQELAKEQAIRLLARREHSRTELQRKLAARGHAAEVVEATLAELAAHGLQSDARFIESYVRSALARGHGERKIRAGLRERGIDCHLLPAGLDLSGAQWRCRAAKAMCKRFGQTQPRDRADEAKRLRFLVNRGFPYEVANAAVSCTRTVGSFEMFEI